MTTLGDETTVQCLEVKQIPAMSWTLGDAAI